MKKLLSTVTFFYILLSIFTVVAILFAQELRPLSSWPAPENKIKGIRIVVAETEELAHQGFCNASVTEFQNTAIWFPDINHGTIFVNTNPGYGTVNKNLQIAFLDRNWSVIKIMFMEKQTGVAVAPENTYSAIEGTPEVIKKLGIKAGKPSPIKITNKNGKYFVIAN